MLSVASRVAGREVEMRAGRVRVQAVAAKVEEVMARVGKVVATRVVAETLVESSEETAERKIWTRR